MDSAQRYRKTKIELTQRSSEKYTSHNENSTPPKSRTNQGSHLQTEVSSRQSSRYQTLEHKAKPAMLQVPQLSQPSREFPGKKNPKNLQIDTDLINKHYQVDKQECVQKMVNATPLFANEDSTTILHRLHNKRKSESKVSYDNLIDAVKLSYSKRDEEKPRADMQKSRYQTQQSKKTESAFNSRHCSSLNDSAASDLVKSIHRHIEQLRQQIGNNLKLAQIDALLDEIQEEVSDSRHLKTESKATHKCLEENEIENSLILREYTHNDAERWFTKEKYCSKQTQSHKVKTLADDREKDRCWRQKIKEKENERDKPRNGFKTKSPLREIINYANKKR